MDEIIILLYYKFQLIDNPEIFVREHKAFCDSLGIKGKVLVASEGINGSVSGTKEQTESYKSFLHGLPGFHDVVFKEEVGFSHPFDKMIVRVRDEIVALKKSVDMRNTGTFLSPQEFLELYEKDKDLIIIDTRNEYEYAVGRFKNAINPQTKTFREFPDFVETLKDKKDKKIIMYCTGGIRCEKASAYMKEQGFSDVSQLHGGIITYVQQLPSTLWEGKCFVFDKRMVTDINQKDSTIGICVSCQQKSDLVKNCRNKSCDNIIIICSPCQERLAGCCSMVCLKEYQQYTYEKSLLTNPS